jgi:7-cyano-7-deazaguanine synthase
VRRNAIVLLSGGLDSTTTLACARREGFEVHALTFRYGQRHALEIEAARTIAKRMQVAKHAIVDVDLGAFGGSALTDLSLSVPKDGASSGIPITYVPARNTVFLSFALAYAEVTGSSDIFVGVNAVDYSGYPDCRPEYVQAFEAMSNLATKAAVEGSVRYRIRTPLISLTKAEIVKLAVDLDADLSLTVSCYDPVEAGACGACDACRIRRSGFEQAGVHDVTRYAS